MLSNAFNEFYTIKKVNQFAIHSCIGQWSVINKTGVIEVLNYSFQSDDGVPASPTPIKVTEIRSVFLE